MFAELTKEEVNHVIKTINLFLKCVVKRLFKQFLA